MTKTFEAKAGDKWTWDPDIGKWLIWLYRDGGCWFFRQEISGISDRDRKEYETDLPAPEALAQLREWGYEIEGDRDGWTGNGHHSMTYPKPFITVGNVTFAGAYSFPSNPQPEFTPPLTESRVREIVAGMLAGHRGLSIATVDQIVAETKEETRAKYAEAIEALRKLVDCYTSAFHPDSETVSVHIEHARAALAKAPPPPNVDVAEPDWKGLLEAVVNARTGELCKALAEAREHLAAARKAVGK